MVRNRSITLLISWPVVRFVYLFIIAVGALALLAWVTGIQPLLKLIPNSVPMNPLVAVMFILSGIGLIIVNRPQKNTLPIILVAIVIISLAIIKLSSFFSGIEIPIDTLLFHDRLHDIRMADASALNFLLDGCALLLIASKKNKLIALAHALCFFILLTSLYAVLGYLYSFNKLHSVEVYFPMPMHTALCFALFSVGTLGIRPRKGFMRIITHKGLGAVLARRLFPIAILLPIFFDWLRFKGENAGIFPNIESGISLISIAAIITLSVVILITAHNLNKIDKSRKLAKMRLIHAKMQAESAKKIQEQFLANMSHEIRTPMNGVVGMIGLMNLTRLDEEQKSYLDTIRISSEILLKIIDDILDFSKIESGKLELEQLPFNIENAIEETFDLLRLDASSKNLELRYLVQPGVPEFIIGDCTRFRQVLVNLVNNGIKFTAAGKILVDVQILEKQGNECVLKISVKDTGIGIEKENLNRLFKAFSQADVSTTRRFGGTGLGLVISANLVKMMNGQIGVESVPGEGSDFYFVIKAKIGPKGIENKDVSPNGTKMHDRAINSTTAPDLNINFDVPVNILIAEDNAINLKILNKTLEKLGFQSDHVYNGLETVNAFEDKFYDIVFMDIQMPVMDGFEATKLLIEKFRDSERKPMIIALTANAIKGERERCLAAGMNEYISKPFQIPDLRNILLKWRQELKQTA